MATTVQEESSCGVKPCSARGNARTLKSSVSTIHKILRIMLHYYSYKFSYVQKLFPSDLSGRETFALGFLAHMEVDNE